MAPDPPARATVLSWLLEGTRLLHTAAAALDDRQMAAPSGLPGWTNAHLLTHLARNADALTNLVDWAATGVETPMYPGGPQQRLADIEAGAARHPTEIRGDLHGSGNRFRTHLADMPEEAWDRTVRTAQGRVVPASTIPWLRVREVWIHAVDLCSGATFADFPDDLADALLDDIVSTYTSKGANAPPLTLNIVPDGPSRTTRPPARGETRYDLTGTKHDLLAWLTGRHDGRRLHHLESGVPALPAWL